MGQSSTIRYTYQDLLSMPYDELHRYEIVDGQLYVTPGPRLNHQQVAMNLAFLMETLARKHDLGVVVGPMTMHVHDEMVLIPDVLFLSRERLDIADFEGHIHGVADLVVEVLSPSTKSYDRDLKRKHYLECGVGELWIVDIDERTVEVWRAGTDEAEIVRDVLTWRVGDESFELPLTEVFRAVR